MEKNLHGCEIKSEWRPGNEAIETPHECSRNNCVRVAKMPMSRSAIPVSARVWRAQQLPMTWQSTALRRQLNDPPLRGPFLRRLPRHEPPSLHTCPQWSYDQSDQHHPADQGHMTIRGRSCERLVTTRSPTTITATLSCYTYGDRSCDNYSLW